MNTEKENEKKEKRNQGVFWPNCQTIETNGYNSQTPVGDLFD